MKAHLKAGLVYFTENTDGSQSEAKKLENDSEAVLVSMQEHWHIYQLGEVVIFVRSEDDVD
jgi:hypothetical protein